MPGARHGPKPWLTLPGTRQGVDVRAALLAFHARYYSANLSAGLASCPAPHRATLTHPALSLRCLPCPPPVSLVVCGRESVAELTALVVALFAGVPNTCAVPEAVPPRPYSPAQLARVTRVVPVKEIRNVSVCFPTRDLTAEYTTQPGHYVAHLVGHEGAGSLLSHLKSLGACLARTNRRDGFGSPALHGICRLRQQS